MKKINLYFRIIRLLLYRIVKGEWQLQDISEISGEDLLDRINSDQAPLIVDVRTAREFNSDFGHIPNAILVPMMQFESEFRDIHIFREKIMELTSNFEDLQSFKEKEVVTICPGGGMSLVAAEIMAEEGFKHVKSLKGGIDQWFKNGHPTVVSSDRNRP